MRMRRVPVRVQVQVQQERAPSRPALLQRRAQPELSSQARPTLESPQARRQQAS
jgi:hypothetical protein